MSKVLLILCQAFNIDIFRSGLFIDKTTIDTIVNNRKYKLVYYDNKYYIIDLNRNKLTYIFPLLNFITRHKLTEISEEELHSIKSSNVSNNNKGKVAIGGYTGIGFLVSVFLRPYINYMYFDMNIWWIIFFILLAIIPLLILKGRNDRKNRRKMSINLDDYRIKAFILPNTKDLLKGVFLNIVGYLLFIFCTLDPIMYGEFSFITFLFIILVFSFILFQNALLYIQNKIEGRIGGIKWKQ
ncbi:DUF443 family protein [Staphylococcus pettenkoferi]|uniref:DUF443 family protein n=1 Tax=Staphylococcus pettenkoferi TaxID=170573 RepID=UPI0011A1B9ED